MNDPPPFITLRNLRRVTNKRCVESGSRAPVLFLLVPLYYGARRSGAKNATGNINTSTHPP